MAFQWGATPFEWIFFSEKLKLTADLLPVVMAQGAVISQGSKLAALGKTPSQYNRDGEVVGFREWTSRISTKSDVEKWIAEDHYGICLQSRSVRALDCDITNSAIVAEVRRLLRETLGFDLPMRWRDNSPKVLFGFVLTPEDRLQKRILKTQDGMIEFLADGQQFVVAGTNQGARIQWEGLENGFPEITPQQFDTVLAVLEMELGITPETLWSVPRGGERARVRINGSDIGKTVSERSNDGVFNYLEEHGHVIEYGRSGEAHIECPFTAEHTSANVVSSTSYFPAGSGGFDRGHFVCLHAHCEGRTDEEFLDAVGYRAAHFDEVPDHEAHPVDGNKGVDKPRRTFSAENHSEIAGFLLGDEFSAKGKNALVRSRGDWFTFNGKGYTLREPDTVRHSTRHYLDRSFKRVAPKKGVEQAPVAFHPSMAQISGVVDALAAKTTHEGVQSPAWLDRRGGDPLAWLALDNGLLNVHTQELVPHDPAFFCVNTLPYSYDENAPEPAHWLEFLEQSFGGDTESVRCLQMMFGYFLTGDTSQQKAFIIKGQKRSGKGTIGRVLSALLGESNCAGIGLESLAHQFGLQNLIGKLVAVIPDARIGGQFTNRQAVVERLLSITGEDEVSIDRKFRDPWQGRLRTRFLMLTNEIPYLGDASGALSSRFIALSTVGSWIGKEDTGLTSKLLAEMPSILGWSLAGIYELKREGFFSQPESGRKILQRMTAVNAPVSEFLDEYYIERTQDETAFSVSTEIYEKYLVWCADQGIKRPTTLGLLISSITDLTVGLEEVQRGSARKGEKRVRGIKGLVAR